MKQGNEEATVTKHVTHMYENVIIGPGRWFRGKGR